MLNIIFYFSAQLIGLKWALKIYGLSIFHEMDRNPHFFSSSVPACPGPHVSQTPAPLSSSSSLCRSSSSSRVAHCCPRMTPWPALLHRAPSSSSTAQLSSSAASSLSPFFLCSYFFPHASTFLLFWHTRYKMGGEFDNKIKFQFHFVKKGKNKTSAKKIKKLYIQQQILIRASNEWPHKQHNILRIIILYEIEII